MECVNGMSNLQNPAYTGKYVPFHPFSFPLPVTSHPNSSSIEPKGNLKYGENTNYHRCSSESILFDEQPSWLEDLLKDPESPFQRGHHCRSASDSFAYLEEAADSTTECKESRFPFADFGAPAVSQNLQNYRNLGGTSVDSKELEAIVSPLDLVHSRDEPGLQYLEGSADKDAGSQARPVIPKSDSKRKQQNAQPPRVRKLQYIAHLEKTIEMMKAEGSGISDELGFLEQQNMILTMENRALRQRLESISQEQLVKQWEQGMLERELARLQTLCHLQKQQQMHMQQQQQQKQQLKQRRNKSRDLDHQANSSFMNKNEAN